MFVGLLFLGIVFPIFATLGWTILAILLCVAIRAFQKSKPISRRRTIAILFVVLSIIVCGKLGWDVLQNKSDRQGVATKPADGFTIEKFDISIDLTEKNVAKVEEKILVNWYSGGHHGIYRTIPYWLEYTPKDGKTISRRVYIEDVNVVGDPFEEYGSDGKSEIKIGDAQTTLPLGLKEYTIQYNYNFGEDPYEGFDEFIFHAFGDYWGTKINNPSIKLTMPKEFDKDKIKFFGDKKRKVDLTNTVEYEVNGNTIYATLPNSLSKSLTIDVELPDGYFKGTDNTYGYVSLMYCAIIFVLMIASALLWLVTGKDKKDIETVEFYAPDNLDVAEVGYINQQEGGRKLTVAMIIQLASKGYIMINESADKKTRVIVKQTDSKIRAQLGSMTECERIVYSALFETGDTVTLEKHPTLYKAFSEVTSALEEKLEEKISDAKSYMAMVISSIMMYISSSYLVCAVKYMEDLDTKYSYLYIIAAVAIVITGIFTYLMGRKNTYGEQLDARIRGFKNYLETAEKEQIDEQAEKNPYYFYDILPYAYVLGVSSVWISKFENIPEPQYPMGSFDYNNSDSIDHLSNDVSTSFDTSGSSSSGSSGCSSCGGGCSSCGGGGSW